MHNYDKKCEEGGWGEIFLYVLLVICYSLNYDFIIFIYLSLDISCLRNTYMQKYT